MGFTNFSYRRFASGTRHRDNRHGPRSAMTAFFRVDSVGKRFASRAVLNSASVWSDAGSITVLAGRNGSGKSTLLRIGSGLLRPDYGHVGLGGEVFLRPRLGTLARRGLFYVPDEGICSWRFTVRAHLDAIAWRFGEAVRLDQGVLTRLGIEQHLDASPRLLSHGERRRVDYAMAFVRHPRVLLADEPLRGTGPLDADRIKATLRELALDGCAIVVTGHEMVDLLEIADCVVWLTQGSTRSLGNPAEAANDEWFRRGYLGV